MESGSDSGHVFTAYFCWVGTVGEKAIKAPGIFHSVQVDRSDSAGLSYNAVPLLLFWRLQYISHCSYITLNSLSMSIIFCVAMLIAHTLSHVM